MSGLSVVQACAVLDAALGALGEHADHLRDLDAAVGDGDLGITVAAGSAAVRQQLASAPPTTVSALLRTTGSAFARANPSTMAALVGAGLLAAAKEVEGDDEWTAPVAERVGRAAAARIAERGKAEPGDKTVLDALVPSLDALGSVKGEEALPAMVDAARSGVEETTGRAGRRGRAAWVGERGVGHPDPGATAFVLFLECLRDAVAAGSASG